MEVVFESEIKELELVAQDEVRDIYALPNEKQLIVHTDRISMFGYELDKPIPFRGVILNQISLYWMSKFAHMASHNIVAHQVNRFPEELRKYEKMLSGRSIIVQNLKTMPLYFHVTGNLTGHDWQTYKETGMLGNRVMPKMMRESDRLESPVMVVSASEALPRKDNIDNMNKWAQRMYGPKIYQTLEEICLSVFGVARNYAGARGIIIANSTFEFALFDGNIYFVNQVMTPESSTYWPSEGFARGKPQPSYEKQHLYDWLHAEGWKNGQPVPEEVPQSVIDETAQRYRALFSIMTGKVSKAEAEGTTEE